MLYFDWFSKDLPRHDEPSGVLACMPFHRALVDAADRLGAVMTLSGEGSDEIAFYMPFHLADLARRGRWLTLWGEAARWSSARNRGLVSLLRQYAMEPIAPILFREGLGPSLRGGYGSWPRLGFFSIPPWVRGDFARRYHLRGRGREYARRMFGPPTTESWNTFVLQTISGDWFRWHLAAPLGMDLSHPFRDPRLVCYALGLPRDVRGIPGVNKPVLQAAMSGVLPEELRAKKCSPGFDDLYGLGLRKNLADIERLIGSEIVRDLGLFDPEALVSATRQAALGIGDARATDRLTKALTLCAWLGQVSRRPLSSAKAIRFRPQVVRSIEASPSQPAVGATL